MDSGQLNDPPRPILAASAGFLFAPLITAGIFGIYTQDLAISIIAYIDEFWISLIIGVPSLLLLSHINGVRWWSCAMLGFIIGSISKATLFETAALSIFHN